MKTPFRRLLALSRPEWRGLGVATIFLLIGSTMGLLYPQAIKRILDGALAAGSAAARPKIDRAALFMMIVFIIQAVAVAIRATLFGICGERIVAQLRERLYRSIMRQEVAFFDERRTGELISRLASDTTVLQSTVSTNISMGLRQVTTVAGGLAFLFYTSPRLTLLMLAIVPAVVVGAVIYGRKLRRLSRQVQDTLAESTQVAEESIGGLRTVRAFAAEEHEATRYGAAVMRSFDLARRRAIASGSFNGIMTMAGYGAVAVVLWIGGRMVAAGDLSVGDLTSFVLYTLTVAFSFGALGDLWADFMRAGGSAERVFELLDRQPSIPTSGGAIPGSVAGRLELAGVEFAYPSRPDVAVLRGIELTIEPGEAVALVGPSGAGKSTISSLLVRLYDPTAGEVRLDGADLRTLDPQWLRRQIGVVAQEPLLFSTSIADNIRYGRAGATQPEVEAAARAANAHDFIARFPDGYATRVGERGVQLSGGQKQRIAIARAVLKDPRVLILDEATSALDAESEHLVKEATARLMKGRTTLIIAHRLSTVIDADRVFVLMDGKIVQTGSHAVLMGEEGLYKRLVERQFVTA